MLKLLRSLAIMATVAVITAASTGKAVAIPVATITNPTNNSTVYETYFGLSGTATVDAGRTVSQCRVYFRRLWDAKNWDPATNSWKVGNTFISTGVSGTNWYISQSSLPSGANLTMGRYRVVVVVIDNLNTYNAMPYPQVEFDFYRDSTPPNVFDIGFNVAASPNQRQVSVVGSYQNDQVWASPMKVIGIAIQRVSDGRYWIKNSDSWATFSNYYPAVLDSPANGFFEVPQTSWPANYPNTPVKIIFDVEDDAGNSMAPFSVYRTTEP